MINSACPKVLPIPAGTFLRFDQLVTDMSENIDIWALVNRNWHATVGELRSQFHGAEPFPHVVIDNFFQPEFLARLHQDFPIKNEEYDRFCIEDGGKVGTNYANGSVDTFPEAFKQLDTLVKSKEFLGLVTEVTGIPKLEYDPDYFGGGIRESQSGIFLPPHLDFNHHPKSFSHRRLNLLFYFNPGWQEAWGGNLQVHKDPIAFSGRSLVNSYMPINNRCLIFETSEISWHGFDRLNLAEGKSRRTFTIYYYTKHRPNENSVKFHNTEYVEPPLPPHFTVGHALTDADVHLLHEYITRRDQRIQMLYDLRRELEGKLQHVWEQYEYYLNLSRSTSTTNSILLAGSRAVGKLKRSLRGKNNS